MLTGGYVAAGLDRPGSCDRMIAENISTQPTVSRIESVSPRISQPDITENTDSMLMISAATTGVSRRWVMICSVNATPEERMPAYRIGSQADMMASVRGSSKTNINTVDISAVTPNWMQLIVTASAPSMK